MECCQADAEGSRMCLECGVSAYGVLRCETLFAVSRVVVCVCLVSVIDRVGVLALRVNSRLALAPQCYAHSIGSYIFPQGLLCRQEALH